MRFFCQPIRIIFNLLEIWSVNTLLYVFTTTITNSIPGVYGGLFGDSIITTDMIPINRMKQEGYSSEMHNVTTEDGYILTVYRIPGPPGSTPVLLQHGFLESSDFWITSGKGKALAFVLSDEGYDVWLGNERGNTYCKKHKTLSSTDPKFWKFSWDEVGFYDNPALINYISDITKENLFYIGHSLGSPTFSVMAIERPDIARRIKAMIALAPANYAYHMRSPIKLIATFWKAVQQFYNLFGIDECFQRGPVYNIFANFICELPIIGNFVCSNLLFLIGGFSPDQLNYSLLPRIFNIFPAGTSTRLLVHCLQLMAVNKFRKFDFGMQGNLKVYNSSEPPDYDISKIQVPIAAFYSEKDWAVGPEDVKKFYNQVPIKLGIYKFHKFNHFDYFWGIDAPDLIYPNILNVLSENK